MALVPMGGDDFTPEERGLKLAAPAGGDYGAHVEAEPRRDEIAEIMAKSEIRVAKIGERTTLVYVKLPCGFEVCETVSTAATGTTSAEDVTNIAIRAAEKKVFELEQYRMHHAAVAAGEAATKQKEG